MIVIKKRKNNFILIQLYFLEKRIFYFTLKIKNYPHIVLQTFAKEIIYLV